MKEWVNGDRDAGRLSERAEANAILAALNSTRWNRKEAARLLNVDYKALLYKMKKFGVDCEQGKSAPIPALLPSQAQSPFATDVGSAA